MSFLLQGVGGVWAFGARYRARMQGQEAAFLRGPEALGYPVQVQRQEGKGEEALGGGILGAWRG